MRRPVKWLAWGLGAPVAGLAGAWAVGAALPVEHTATAERTVAGTPAEVWEVMTQPEAFPAWRPGVRSVKRLPDRDGLAAWRETSATGTLTLEITEWDPPFRMRTRIADEDLPFGGTWSYRLEPAVDGTRVTITEDGEIHSPFFRFVSRFVMGYDGTMNDYLDGLEARMSDAVPAR